MAGTSKNEVILIVDDEKLLRWSLRERLKEDGYKILEAGTGAEARAILASHFVDLVLLDIKLPDCNGLEILAHIRERGHDATVLLMTAYSSVEDAVNAMRMGAYNYLTKPFNVEELSVLIEKALESTQLKRQIARLHESMQSTQGLDNVVGRSLAMAKVFDLVLKVAQFSTTTVLITGESGVGKDVLAKALHLNSDRAMRPFMNLTCTTITESLLESELFGHERGAFTDAKNSKKGLFELADGGTVFLDEIGDMPAALQAKLLRFLQDKTFKRVGGSQDVTVDVRIIAATNKDLPKLVEDGGFRGDLFYRLDTFPIAVPPLRERDGDVTLLAQHFIDLFNKQFRKHVKGLTSEALERLDSYHWPGNVRELKNVVERAMILGSGELITEDNLPQLASQPKAIPTQQASVAGPYQLPPDGINLEELERDLLIQALRRANGVKTKAGRLLGLNRDQIRYRMKSWGLTDARETWVSNNAQ
ncbi:MAG: sigma-54 dependent transcriptional regulator [Planctomycetota bacterium]|nr:sigma-54 dependent transcriptional regulator [Planctomycetota bacterium]